MKQILKIDFENRRKYKYNELNRKLLKIFKMNRLFSINEMNKFFMYKLARKSRKSGICRIKNLCFFTNYSRSVIKFFGMQRRFLRIQIRLALLSGIKKIRW